ncbi:MAG: type II toxin-antitoxin system RelE/ParE family toxin [Spirochaeta sp.]|nr:type II toxin-antitoxin system RelE/ParE family toxin [Spirochaeta sp.]
MNYSIRIKNSAKKALARIDRPDRQRIITRIDELAENPAAGSVLKGEFSGLRRVRVGAYRVVYEIRDEELVVLVVRIAHRREVYRGR